MTCVRSKAMPVGVEKAHGRPGMVPHLYDSLSQIPPCIRVKPWQAAAQGRFISDFDRDREGEASAAPPHSH